MLSWRKDGHLHQIIETLDHEVSKTWPDDWKQRSIQWVYHCRVSRRILHTITLWSSGGGIYCAVSKTSETEAFCFMTQLKEEEVLYGSYKMNPSTWRTVLREKPTAPPSPLTCCKATSSFYRKISITEENSNFWGRQRAPARLCTGGQLSEEGSCPLFRLQFSKSLMRPGNAAISQEKCANSVQEEKPSNRPDCLPPESQTTQC